MSNDIRRGVLALTITRFGGLLPVAMKKALYIVEMGHTLRCLCAIPSANQ